VSALIAWGRRAAAAAARGVRGLAPGTVVAIAWGVLILYAFPGIMTRDSFDHLSEARSGIYTDSHPPAINLLWRALDYAIAGPLGMLLLQTGTLVLGLYLILRRTFAPRRAAWVTAAIALFPPVAVTMAVIWKDCVMAGCFAMGIAGLLSPRRGARLAGLAALGLAGAVRYNALGATLPLVVLLFEWRPGASALRRYAIAGGAWLAITAAGLGLNAAITDQKMHYWHSSLALYDIVGTLVHVDGELPDAELRALLAGTELRTPEAIHATMRALYTTRHFFPIINDERRQMWSVPINGYTPAPASQRRAIERAWWDTVTRYLGAYAQHRLAVTADALGFYGSRGASAVAGRRFPEPGIPHQLGLSTGWSKLQNRMTKWMRALWSHTPIFVPYVYLIASLLLLPLARRHRDVLALLLSGLGITATLLPLVHSNDYRYSHWLVLCTVLAAAILIARRARAPGTGASGTAAARAQGAADPGPGEPASRSRASSSAIRRRASSRSRSAAPRAAAAASRSRSAASCPSRAASRPRSASVWAARAPSRSRSAASRAARAASRSRSAASRAARAASRSRSAVACAASAAARRWSESS
jgi:hypothetical protein